MVTGAVGLHAEGVNGGTLAEIKHPALEGNGVGHAAHCAAEGVDFKDEMTLGGAADGGVAGHIGNCVEGEGKEGGACAETGGGEGGFDAGVTAADDGDLEGI